MKKNTKVEMTWGMMKGKPATVIDIQIRSIPTFPDQSPCKWYKYKIRYDNPNYGISGWLNDRDMNEISESDSLQSE